MRARNMYRQCLKKKRYRDEKFARRVAKTIKDGRGVELRVYPCTLCNGWHLTHQPLINDGTEARRGDL